MYKVWKKWMFLTVCAGLLAGCSPRSGGVVLQKEREGSAEQSRDDDRDGQEEQGVIGIYICGEVRRPGVYELEAGARVTDAIEAAGGTTGKASLNSINLAEYVEDGQKIEIPSRAEEKKKQQQSQAGSQSQGLVNINQATAAELMTLPGIGESRAGDIVSYRQAHGNFGTVKDIMNVAGIKEGIYNRIKDKITT